MSVAGVGQANAAQNQFGPLMVATPVPGVPPEVYSGDLFGPPIQQAQPPLSYPAPSFGAAPRSPQIAQAAAAAKRRHDHHILYAILGGIGVVTAGLVLFAVMRRGAKPVTRPKNNPAPTQASAPQRQAAENNEKAKADYRLKKVDDDDDDVDVHESHDHQDEHIQFDEAEEQEEEEHE